MKRAGLVGAGWPDDVELTLARLATAPVDDPTTAWSRHLAARPLDEVAREEELWLLDALWARVEREGTAASVPEAGRLKGIHRRNWVLTTAAARTTGAASHLLADASIDHLHPPLELVPARLLVAPGRIADAIGALIDAGWSTTDPRPPRLGARPRRLTSPDGQALDLAPSAGRWLLDHSDPDAGWRWFADRAATVAAAGARRLDPADALVALCTDGPTPSAGLRLRWIPAAATVLERVPDPDRVAATSRRFGVGRLVHDALTFLSRDVGLAVAPELIGVLTADAHPTDHLDRALATRHGPGRDLRLDLAVLQRQAGSVAAALRTPALVLDRVRSRLPRRLPGVAT